MKCNHFQPNSKLGIIVFMIFFIVNQGYSQFKLSAEMRPRAEVDNGSISPLPDTINTLSYISQRTRLSFDYTKAKVQLKLTIQDVRLWGSGNIYSKTGVFGNTSGLDVNEAWFKIDIGNYSSIKIGRQIIKFDNQRLISWRNWNQFGLSYDAVSLKHKLGKTNIDISLSYNNFMNYNNGKVIWDNDNYTESNLMKTFNFIRLNRKFGSKAEVSVYAIASGFANSLNKDIIYITATTGFYSKLVFNSLEIPIDFYYQFGKAQSGKDVSAFAFGINPKFNLTNFKIGIGADYLSGDNAKSASYNNKERTFNKFYGAGYAFHGWMNQYVYIKGSTNNSGLVDIYPSINWLISKNHIVDFKTHFFSLANATLINNNIIEDKNIGTELDFRYTYKPLSELKLELGFSYYIKTNTYELIRTGSLEGNKEPYWAWLMISFKPTLFNYNK